MNFTSMAQQPLLKSQVGGAGDALARKAGHLTARGESKEQAREGLRSATEEFEAIFLYQMISAMRQTVGDGGLIEKSNAEEIFEGMLDEEWSRKLAGRHGSRGLAEVLYQQLSRQMGLEEEGPAPANAASSRGPALLPDAHRLIATVRDSRKAAGE